MEVVWSVFNGIFSGIWPEFAAIGWYKLGMSETQVLFTLLVTSNLIMVLNYGVLGGVFWEIKKVLSERVNSNSNGGLREIMKWYSQWKDGKKTKEEEMGKKIADILSKYKYLILFMINLVPMIPSLSTATIIAARLAKVKYDIIPILLGNTVKLCLWVTLIYSLRPM